MQIMRANYVATFAVLLFGSLFVRQIRSEEALNIEAQQYLEENSDRNADAHWESNFHRRAEEAMRENQSISDEERYANDKVLESVRQEEALRSVERQSSFGERQNRNSALVFSIFQ